MSEVSTNAVAVNSGVNEQVAQDAQLSAEQQAGFLAEAKKELSLVVKALRGGNRENAVSQYLAGMHGLKFINLCRKGGKSRSFATGELERDLSWWLGRSPWKKCQRRHRPIHQPHSVPRQVEQDWGRSGFWPSLN
jgi:hypothetical protein